MKAKIHFIIILLITLISHNSFSQGSGWVEIYQLPQNEGILDIHFGDSYTGYAGGIYGKLYKTTNRGANWIKINHSIFWDFNSVFFFDSHTGLLGSDYGRMYRTTNGGQSIDTIYPGYGDHFLAIRFPSPDTGYTVTAHGCILKSINGGLNWITLKPPMSNNAPEFRDLYCPINNNIFTVGRGGSYMNIWNVYRSLNGGLTWDSTKVDSYAWINSVYFVNENTGFIAGYKFGQLFYEGLIYKTTNSGNNWTLKFIDSSSVFESVHFINSNTGFAVGSINDGALAKTTDGGETWHIHNDELFYGLYTVYFVDASTGVAAGAFRIIRTTNGGVPIGIQPINSEIPNTFSLSQNYPNPFNPVTRIKYDIPLSKGARGMMTKLIIYDVLGKEVQTLVNQHLSPGTYEVSFDGSDLSSGVYYYRLEAGDYSQTRKMVMVK